MTAFINKFTKYLFKGQLPGILYEKVFIYLIPQWRGFFSFVFYRLLYRGFTYGENLKCWGRIIISKSPESIISIGDNAWIVSDTVRSGIALYSKCKLQAYRNSRIAIGNNVALIGTSVTCRSTLVEIGDGTIIAPNVIIVDSDFHAAWPPHNRALNMGYENDKEVRIGKNVWIGMNVLILKGVTIGDNSIVAAGSVVVKDLPSNVIAGGNPAGVLKSLPVEDSKTETFSP
ncbi:MAG: acyltransferase [Nitrospirae bacterium]|nr:acyltransferase [Nitrospirota bacterium]